MPRCSGSLLVYRVSADMHVNAVRDIGIAQLAVPQDVPVDSALRQRGFTNAFDDYVPLPERKTLLELVEQAP